MRRVCTIVFCLISQALVSAEKLPSFHYTNFASPAGIRLVNNASLSGKALRLTPAKANCAGAVWFDRKQRVRSGFETEFQFQLTGQGGLGHGADGFAFVLQNGGSSAIAGRGSAGGFAVGDGYGNMKSPGIPHSIAVFFDTFRNHEEGDPSNNYIAICTHGKIAEMRWPPPRLAHTAKLKVHLKDGQTHSVRVLYKPPIMSIYLDNDGTPVLTSAVDLSSVLDAEGNAYVGFTASTGAGYENHDILNWSFSGLTPDVGSNMSMVTSTISYLKTTCRPDRNLCTPERATVEYTGEKRYHIVLPADLEWGASIPITAGSTAKISNAVGNICWDLKSRGADGCNGPAGNGTTAGPGFAMPEEKAGALVSRVRTGSVKIYVNDQPGGAFKDNEGYFEFDVEIR